MTGPAPSTRTDVAGIRRAAMAVAVIALVVFLPSLRNGFVNFDDYEYVLKNGVVRQGLTIDGIRWAFTTWTLSNYHPLTWLSHMVDVSLWGVDPVGHHLSSVLLHALNAGLVVFLVRALQPRIDIDIAVVVGLLFSLHPLRVESVTWISERKDLLSGLFFCICLLAWIEGRRRGRDAWLLASFGAFVLGLLSKSMVVTVPPLIVVLEVLVLGHGAAGPPSRGAKAVLALLFVTTVLFSVLTMQTQADAMMDVATYPPAARLMAAPVHLVRYLGMTIWPHDLAPLYPVQRGGVDVADVVVAVVVLLVGTAAATIGRRQAPLLLVGWLWFLGMLVPVLGLVQVGRAAVADRYTYLPHLGLFIAIAVAVAHLGRRGPVILGGVALALTPLTVAQIGVWRDTRTLFSTSVTRAPGSAFSHDALAGELLEHGDTAAAIVESRRAVSLAPTVPRYRERLAQALAVAGAAEEAEGILRNVLQQDPRRGTARFALSAILRRRGALTEALVELERSGRDARDAGDEALAARVDAILAAQRRPPSSSPPPPTP